LLHKVNTRSIRAHLLANIVKNHELAYNSGGQPAECKSLQIFGS